MALRGVTVANAPGTIDSGYRGEIKVMLVRIGGLIAHGIQPGDRIAQLVLQRYKYFDAEWVSELDDTERGAGGFGSTGMV
jgi:dUTP pyrophosphatase